jgi:predicted nucleic acid-binding Zn ribbon protein
MARKSLGYSKLLWVCPNCDTRNPGPKKSCSTCGTPQPKDVEFIQADAEELLKDTNTARAVKKGADIHCPYCGTRNSADAAECKQCSGDLSGAMKRKTGSKLGAFGGQNTGGIKCPSCGTINPPNAPRCGKCGSGLHQSSKKISQKDRKKKSPLPWIIISILVLSVVGFVVARTRNKSTVDAVVQDLYWQRSIPVEEYKAVQQEGWWDEIPEGADIVACEDAARYTSDEPEENSIEVCGTPYTVDTGTGYGEVVQDCEYEVYDSYCTYEIGEWTQIDILQSEGYGNSPQWPSAELRSNQREGEAKETYTIVFDSDEGQIEFKTDDADVFASFYAGETVDLVLDGFGNIRDIYAK